MKRQNWLEIDDYIYGSMNLDAEEKMIIAVIISFTKDGKKFYMSQTGLSKTYGMPLATVQRKFTELKKLNILIEDENGLRVDMKELEYVVNIDQKFRKTRKGGPGRKKKPNHVDLTINHVDLTPPNHVDLTINHVDLTINHVDLTEQNQHDLKQNQCDLKKNQVDLQLLKDYNKELPKEEITKDITKVINSDLGVSEETPKSNPQEDLFFDDMDLTERFNYKPNLIEEDKKDITKEELEDFLKELDI